MASAFPDAEREILMLGHIMETWENMETSRKDLRTKWKYGLMNFEEAAGELVQLHPIYTWEEAEMLLFRDDPFSFPSERRVVERVLTRIIKQHLESQETRNTE